MWRLLIPDSESVNLKLCDGCGPNETLTTLPPADEILEEASAELDPSADFLPRGLRLYR